MRQNEENPRGLSTSLANALDRHFVACAAAATVAAVAGHAAQSEAAIIYSGPQNIAETFGPPGLYINLVTKVSSTVKSSVTGWDINPYVSDSNFLMYTPVISQLVKSSTGAGAADVGKLTAGTSIGAASTFISNGSGFMNNASIGDWNGSGSGYMGIKFTEAGVNGGSPVFGWVQISKNAGVGAASGITFVDWAYDNTGAAIAAGAGTPEPSSLALLAAGAVGLLVRRGRAKLRSSAA